MNVLKNLAVALAMYSKIPVPQFEWKKEHMQYALLFFPLVGVICGGCTLLWGIASAWLPFGTIFVTAVYVLIPVAITGGIHLDGLLDVADALASWQTRERRLEIMGDSHAGAFAVIACCAWFLASFGVWSEVTDGILPVLAGCFVLSRALSGYGVAAFPCAKESGLAKTFAENADRLRVKRGLLIEFFVVVLLMMLWDWFCGLLAAAAACVTLSAYRVMCDKKFGGITGDTQGFFLQICELVTALAVVIGDKIPV